MTRRSIAVLVMTVLCSTAGLASQDLEARYRSGAQALERRQAVTAIELLSSVAEEQPGYRDTRILLGQSYLMIGDDRAAKRQFESVLDAKPNHGQAAFLLGFSLYQGARYFEAAEALERATLMSPDHPLPKMYRGLALLRLGEVDGARTEIELALRFAPGDPVALSALAELELSLGNHDAAESSIRRVLAVNPNDVEAQLLLGRTLLESGRPLEAGEVFAAVLGETSTTRSDVLYLLAQSQLRGGDASAGQRTLQRFQSVRDKEEQVRVLRSALSAEPDDIDAGLELTGLLLELGHRQLARLQLADLDRRAPNDRRVDALLRTLGN